METSLDTLYDILEEVGEGRNTVYLAVNQRTAEKVCLKVVDKTYDKSYQNFVQQLRLHNEANSLQSLSHPNIVTCNRVEDLPDCCFLELELVNGIDLVEFISLHGKLSEQASRHVFRQLVDAVVYLHTNNYCHRDIKGDNILLDDLGNIKLVDFEFCTKFEESRPLNKVVGSMFYSAPELLNRQNYYGPQVDIWSLGVTLYSMLFGRLPWHTPNRKDLHQAIHTVPVYFPPTQNISPELKDLILKMLSIDPDKRPTAEEVADHSWLSNQDDDWETASLWRASSPVSSSGLTSPVNTSAAAAAPAAAAAAPPPPLRKTSKRQSYFLRRLFKSNFHYCVNIQA
eukprot:CAMPEP_0177652636 /NCGR_PEP_ID=MMETSP0447-20121125/13246_1 /TAXON_ID=0 /ORGANISM="Stygamoeba regulata, Strain BSH-02190019" /LENGTH=340 /DNA_ID=CAMNT_0019155915 /DNA_START=136 /DNA_END=1158 /DNA_ORIENTATION=+